MKKIRIIAALFLCVLLLAASSVNVFGATLSDSYYSCDIVFVLDENSEYSSIDDLDGQTLAVQTAVCYEDEIKDRIPRAQWDYYQMPNDMILALQSGKAAAYLIEEVGFAAQKFEHSELRRIEEAAGSIDFAVVIGENSRKDTLTEQINEFIAKYKSNGEYERMYSYWISNWNPDTCTYTIPEFTGENGTLTVGVEGAYEPFSFESDGKLMGFDIEFVCMFCLEYGYKPSFEEVPFDSIAPAAETGKYDLGLNIVVTDERQDDTESSFYKTFIKENRWKMFLEGIGNTTFITLASILFGTILGFLIYMACRHGNKPANALTGFFSWLIDGMPTVVLLMILYYVIFGKSKISGSWVSIIGFTLIFAFAMYDMLCVGCNAIPIGQTEASRALGYSDKQSFFKIILPQAARHFLPIYKNEVVSLIKETSVVGYIAVHDLTKISDLIRSRTYEAFFALIATAIAYFLIAGIMIAIVKRIEIYIDPHRRPEAAILKGIKQIE